MLESEITDIFTPENALATETCDITTLQQRKEGINRINEVLLKVLKGENITQELLKRIALSYELLGPYSPLNKTKRINEEREENLRTYNKYKIKFYKEYTGKYVVIAKGKVQVVGESFDDVKNVALDASHRFIFKVEPKKKVRGILRWPMKRK